MKFGIGLVPQYTLNEIIETAKLAESVGFQYFWLADKPNTETYLILEKIAQETETIKIGYGVTNPYIKTPEKIAHEMIHINQISENRAILGIGPGNKQLLNELNQPWKSPINTLKKSIETISKIHSQYSKHKIPIYIEASSKKLLELGGKYCDGVLISASHPTDYQDIYSHVKKGVSTTKNNKLKLDISAYTSTSIAKDIALAKNASRLVVAFIIAGSPPHVLQKHKIPSNISNKIYIKLCEGNIGGALRLINDDFLNHFSVTGTPNDIIIKINKLKNNGVTQFIAGAPIGNNLETSIKLFEDVISSF